MDIAVFQRSLSKWWRAGNKREFAWRDPINRTPYLTLVAEIMLRRTQARQVEPVYVQFITRFPTLKAAALADTDAIREMLFPLGLSWRIQNFIDLIREAEMVGETNLSQIENLMVLPGVGDYVSKAVVCFSRNKPVALVDVNVVRVLGRLLGLNTAGEARRRKEMREAAEMVMDRKRPADYHYALLDFAALVCTAGTPKCEICPVRIRSACTYNSQRSS